MFKHNIKLGLALQILGSYKTDPNLNEMFKRLDFYITPVLNMDGYVFSWKDNTVNIHLHFTKLFTQFRLHVAYLYLLRHQLIFI